MAKVLITGSADGLGLMVGELLVEQGHAVVLHARNEARAEDARAALPQAEAVLIGAAYVAAAAFTIASAPPLASNPDFPDTPQPAVTQGAT